MMNAELEKRLETQNEEFRTLRELLKAYNRLPPIVDDDYPEARHNYESAMQEFLRALAKNGRCPTVETGTGAGFLTFKKFRDVNVERCRQWHPQGINSWSASDWLTALVGEVGELASLIKMRNRERDGLKGNKFVVENLLIRNELADILTYLDLLAASFGVDLAAAVIFKFNEVSIRNGFKERL